MANLRVIKKDIVFLVNEVISDCWMFMSLHPDQKQAEAQQIIADAIELGDNLFEQVNHYPKEDARHHFRMVNQKLISGVDELFKRISELAQ